MKTHISAATLAATEWYVRLSSGEASERDYQAWQAWKNAAEENAQAWAELESVTKQFSGMDAKTAMAVLDHSKIKSPSRRRALKHLGILLGVGVAGAWTYRQQPWLAVMAGYRTDIGEQKQVALADGTHLILNTNSMVDVAYTPTQRAVKLLRGEVLIETAQENASIHRPFVAYTEHGALTALGTRFSVRLHSGFTQLNVFEHAVEITPADAANKTLVKVGETLRFNAHEVLQKTALPAGADAWGKGFIVVDKMPLRDLLAELSRYRNGVLRCDPAVEEIRISGAYPVRDIDAALTSISKNFALRIEKITSYWVTVRPA